MRIRLPLYSRFLIWFLLNLLLLAAVFGTLVITEFRFDALMASFAGERVQQVANVILGELGTRPRDEWNNTLTRFDEAYGIQFAVYDERYEHLAGTELKIPEALREKARTMPMSLSRPGGDDRPVPPGGDPGGPPGEPRRFGGGRPDLGPPRSFFRTSDPPGYWAIVRAPLRVSERGRPQLARLIVHSRTLSAGGLFFDFTPWWLAGGAVLVISALWWLPFVGSITRSVRQMTSATEQIAEGRFDVAVNDRRTDELGRLGGAINRMSVRLAGFVTGQKRFLGDIAHELCSPLARMEMALGVMDQRAGDSDREYLNDVREEVRHMSGLVNELLMFSKAGLKPKDAVLAPVNLAAVAQEVIDRECPDSSGVILKVPEHLTARADFEQLSRALGNLVRNALRYAGSAGPVTVSAQTEGSRVLLSVADEGPGVPAEDLARLGEPFFRPDFARGRETGGTGLGLAIVRSCTEACGGTITFQNRQPLGFLAQISLPASEGRPS